MIGLPAAIGKLQQALLMELAPGEPLMSRDNIASMAVDNVATGRLPGLAARGIAPASIGAVAPGYLGVRRLRSSLQHAQDRGPVRARGSRCRITAEHRTSIRAFFASIGAAGPAMRPSQTGDTPMPRSTSAKRTMPWSMRPWVLLRQAASCLKEVMVRFDSV